MTNPFRLLSLICVLGLLSACGGSLESDSEEQTQLVLVSAGADLSVNEQVTVTLTGEAAGQTTDLTYSWSISPDLTITQDDTSSATATLETPETTTTLTYELTLTVTDGDGNQGQDSRIMTVSPVNTLPEASISVSSDATTVNGAYPAGVVVKLDGSDSDDSDPVDANNPIADYTWSQTAGTDVISGISLDGDSISFTTPVSDEDNSLTFLLTVVDGEGGEDTATVTIDVLSASNTKPSADAGVDHQVFSGESIILTGVADSTVTAAKPLTYEWLNDSSLDPTIDDASALQTFAVAPSVSSEERITFTLQVTDQLGSVSEDSVTVTVLPVPVTVMNDTGVLLQASDDSISSTHQAEYPGQDGQRGDDIISDNGLLDKAGRGDNGFDFTRLDDLGDEVDDTSDDWTCVRDNITGLVWESKTTDAGLHSSEHIFTWYQGENTGGYEGDATGAAGSCTLTTCTTADYANAVNSVGLCGAYDWRLPTMLELMSIVHYGQTSSPMIDDEYFPNTTDGLGDTVWYWTSESSADGVASTSQAAWAINFANANDNFLNKATGVHIRLVRGGRE